MLLKSPLLGAVTSGLRGEGVCKVVVRLIYRPWSVRFTDGVLGRGGLSELSAASSSGDEPACDGMLRVFNSGAGCCKVGGALSLWHFRGMPEFLSFMAHLLQQIFGSEQVSGLRCGGVGNVRGGVWVAEGMFCCIPKCGS